jgi:hypothetical protein
VLHSIPPQDERLIAAVDSLRERGLWPAAPADRVPLDIAMEIDAVRHMTPEQRRDMPFEVHGNHYLRKLQLVAEELGAMGGDDVD